MTLAEPQPSCLTSQGLFVAVHFCTPGCFHSSSSGTHDTAFSPFLHRTQQEQLALLEAWLRKLTHSKPHRDGCCVALGACPEQAGEPQGQAPSLGGAWQAVGADDVSVCAFSGIQHSRTRQG